MCPSFWAFLFCLFIIFLSSSILADLSLFAEIIMLLCTFFKHWLKTLLLVYYFSFYFLVFIFSHIGITLLTASLGPF